MTSNRYWNKRYTVRCFTDEEVPESIITSLIQVSERIPTQQSFNDNLWFCLKNSKHYNLKKWLLENVYNQTKPGEETEYMVQVLSAPVVFLSTHVLDMVSDPQDVTRNIGIHAGALMEHTLKYGYDIATIGCIQGNYTSKGFSDKINKVFRKQIEKMTKQSYINLAPNLAVCIGKGYPLENNNFKHSTYKGYRYVSWQKTKKEWLGIIK